MDIVISNKHKHRAPHAYAIRQQLYRFKSWRAGEKEKERETENQKHAIRCTKHHEGHRVLVCLYPFCKYRLINNWIPLVKSAIAPSHSFYDDLNLDVAMHRLLLCAY